LRLHCMAGPSSASKSTETEGKFGPWVRFLALAPPAVAAHASPIQDLELVLFRMHSKTRPDHWRLSPFCGPCAGPSSSDLAFGAFGLMGLAARSAPADRIHRRL
jgi:hypothetical protein